MIPKKPTTLSIGKQHEKQAETFLQQQGLYSITNNFRSRMGEIDLIMQHEQCLVFVEVRYRKNAFYGSATETVNYQKQRKLVKTAYYFLARYPQYQKMDCRFDIVGISQQGQQIDWITNAFSE